MLLLLDYSDMKSTQAGLITLQELSQRTGVGGSTLNYYTSLGLLQVADRKGNRRFYRASEVLRRIEEIRRLRRVGYSLQLIQQQIRRGERT